MKVAIVGASGNTGTSLLRALEGEARVREILGVARRLPHGVFPKTRWIPADISQDDLTPLFQGVDAVVHLAWLIQPSHDLGTMRATNVDGSARLFEAVAEAGVRTLVYASSVGAYSPAPKDRRVDESWPTDGVPTSFYSRHKAEVERILDDFEARHPDVRVVRLRPALIFKRESGSEVRRLFFGPLLPSRLLTPRLIPAVPKTPRLVFQCVHSYDVGEAYRLALVNEVRGAFNVGAEPILDGDELARLLDARAVKVPERLIRGLFAATWRSHLQPTPPGWIDMAYNAPLMDFGRARSELGWRPVYTAGEAVLDLLDGVHDGAGIDTPPLLPDGRSKRLRELLTGIGRRA